MPSQECPGCGARNEVGIFVSGQRVRCAACTHPFVVQRPDSVAEVGRPEADPPSARRKPALALDPGRAEVPRLDASRAEVPRFDAGRAEAPRFDAGRAEAPRFDAGRAEAPRPDAGRAEVGRACADPGRRDQARPRWPIRPHPVVEQKEAEERAQRRRPVRPEAPTAAKKPDGEPVPPDGTTPVEPQPPDIIGFELFEVIGKGGMGRVYRARQRSLDRPVAIKVLNEELAQHKSFVRRFEKETASLAALQHPHISAIIDRGQIGSTWYFAMEYIDGPSLRMLLCQRPPVDRLLEIAITLCRALGHAHQRGIIHRDLKPENVLFTRDFVLKVVDFGLANILDEERRWELTRTKVSMGTVNYMAPEQRRDAKNVDHRADIYSLGVMLYEMLTGELPLGRFHPPSHHRPGIDPRLDEIALKLLDADPDRRPQRLEIVAASLESIRNLRTAPELPITGLPEALLSGPSGLDSRSGFLPTQPSTPRRRLGGLSMTRLFAGLALVLLLFGGALAAYAFLFKSGLSDGAADVVIDLGGGHPRVSLVHPRLVRHIPPQAVTKEGQRRRVSFDFRPSRLPPMPIRLSGGDWEWEERRGALVQDTCRSAMTVNQRPATAALGEPRPLNGLTLRAEITAKPAAFDAGQGPKPLKAILDELLGETQLLAPLKAPGRVGLGMLDNSGTGIEVLLALDGSRRGLVLRSGGDEVSFPIEPPLREGRYWLELRLDQRRLALMLDDRALFESDHGLVEDFVGTPFLACQNARCVFTAVELVQ